MNNKQEKTNHSTLGIIDLKKMAHHLKPVVQVGKQGITQSLILEIKRALIVHELIKVKSKLPLESVAKELDAEIIMVRGNITTLYLPKKEE